MRRSSKLLPQITFEADSDSDSNNDDNDDYSDNDNGNDTCKIRTTETASAIFDIILDDLMYGYKTEYQKSDYWLLYKNILKLVQSQRILKLFLPAFPSKSSNTRDKVLGVHADFVECEAINTLLKIARDIQTVYSPGVLVIIMSDYHTFNQFIEVSEDSFTMYHESLKKMIHDKGADNVIQLISLLHFKDFKNVPSSEISVHLAQRFGGMKFLEDFEQNVRKTPELMRKYTQHKRFFKTDLSPKLLRSPNSKRKAILKEVATGMLSQGHALDTFLKEQKDIKHYIRLSIHNHNPNTGKFAVDLFKNRCFVNVDTKIRTPWHNTAVFDTLIGQFNVNFKEKIMDRTFSQNGGDFLLELVYFQERPWFFVHLYLSDKYQEESLNINVSMIKDNCGILIENNKTKSNKTIKPDIFRRETILSLVKEFGVVILRGFGHFEDENDFLEHYKDICEYGVLPWSFGPIHKVMPSEVMPGYVNSNGGIPVHWDMVAPPKYMGINQNEHRYEDFTCPMFALYCKSTNKIIGDTTSIEGATTFIDTKSAVLSMDGKPIAKWKQISLEYETELNENESTNVYFGGKGNVYAYPLIHTCPDGNQNVLRWWQSWKKDEYPDSKQHNHFKIVSRPRDNEQTPEQLEQEIQKLAFDDRFFFTHAYKEGDLVHVNNYTMLHGRNGFSHNKRELWRVQALPTLKTYLNIFYLKNKSKKHNIFSILVS